jgi:hypothetical protein
LPDLVRTNIYSQASSATVEREEEQVGQLPYVPHIDLFLQALRINRERLDSRSKIAIDARLLRALLQTIVESAPFSEEFYLQNYPDIAKAHAAGDLPDPKRHFVERGYFEGRLGAPAEVDEAYYLRRYPDVEQAVLRGDLKSIAEHFHQSGYAEGRTPSAALEPFMERWLAAMRDSTGRG